MSVNEKKIKLIATDLDGTLLDSSGKIPEKNREALARAIERGVAATIATGRMFGSASKFAAQIGVSVPMICYNGAMVRHPNGETLYHHKLDMDIALEILAVFKERGTYVQSYIDDELYIKDSDASEFRYYLAHYGIMGQAIGDALYAPTTAPTKLLAMTSGIDETHALMKKFSEMFGEKLYVTSSNPEFVELMNPIVNKARSLVDLASSLGLDMSEVMALGDGENDVEMLRAAGIGVAMGNARERAKNAADDIAPTNDECGVAWAVEKYTMN